MRKSSGCSFFIILVLAAMATSCASTKTMGVWKDVGSNKQLGKVLVIAVSELDFMQRHFENVLSNRLESRGIDAVPASKVFGLPGAKLTRETVLAKVGELGVTNVLVARVVGKEETARLYEGGAYAVPLYSHSNWYSQSFGSAPEAHAAYDAELFTVVTNIYEVAGEKLIWSSLSRVKVENSRQAAINPFINLLMKQLEESGML